MWLEKKKNRTLIRVVSVTNEMNFSFACRLKLDLSSHFNGYDGVEVDGIGLNCSSYQNSKFLELTASTNVLFI